MADTDQQPKNQQPQSEEDVSEMTIRPKQTILLLAGFAVILVIVWFGISVSGSSALSSAISDWEQAGNPTSVSQLEPEGIDPDQNAAVLYANAFARFPSLGRADWQMLREPWRIRDVEALGRLVVAAEEPLSLAHQAADLEQARWPLDYTDADSLLTSVQSTILPSRGMAQLLAAEAVYKARTGDLEGAVESIDAGLALGNHLLADPLLINLMLYLGELNNEAGQAVPPGIEDITLATLMVTFRDNQLPENSLRDRITAVQLRAIYPRVLMSEGAVAIENFTADDGVDRSIGSLADIGVETPWWYVNGFAQMDMAHYLNAIRKDSDHLGMPLFQQSAAGFEPLPSWAPLTNNLLPSRDQNVNLRIAAARGRLSLAYVALLLREYKKENGEYPEELADLDAPLPVDPFTGRPLAYLKRTDEDGGGFIVGTAGRGDAIPLDWAWK